MPLPMLATPVIMAKAEPPLTSLSAGRKAVYGLLIAAVLLGGCFVALESALRWAGVGFDPTFFRKVHSSQPEATVRENRWVTAPYFSAERVRRPFPFRLPLKKASDAYRIFVLGSSAAMGDPEPSFSIARQLEVMLASAYPETHFEVVNAGITAINSHVLRHLAADAAELQPDLFIVYEGHNEVIGPFGPGTVFTSFLQSPDLIRWADLARRTRIGQWMNERRSRADRTREAWGGMQMFLHQQIAVDDVRLETTRRSFAENLRAIADAGAAAGARTLVCTVLTNQRDFAPFLSGHRTTLSAPEQAEWEAQVEAGTAALHDGRVAVAESHYRRALAIDDQHADLTFRLARVLLGQRKADEARQLFQRALDLDQLRFRTDSRLNQQLRTFDHPAADVVDLEAAAAAISAGGIVGEELLLEHVHLNFAGTYFVARTLFQKVGEDLLRRARVDAVVTEPLPAEALRVRLGYTAYEQAMIIRELLDRYSRPPFTAQGDHADRVRGLRARESAAAQLLARPETADALTGLYLQARQHAPNDWVLARNTGMALVGLGRPQVALVHLEDAQRVIDDDAATLFAQGVALRQLGRSAEADRVFARLRELEPRYPGLPTAAAEPASAN